jgi:AbiU2
MTGDELKQRNIDTMGETLGKQYTALFQEFASLNLYWKEFLELFGTNDKRIARMNQSAPGFFQMLQKQQFETNMSHLARLTDSSKSVGKENLTIRNLPELVTDPGLKAELEKHVEDIKQKTEFCRDWRNRRFAHHDLLLATQDGRAEPLEPATKEKIVAALQAVSDMLNVMERFYYRGVCAFDVIAAHNGANTLLSILGFGIMARDKMMERIKKGDFSGGDTPENI